MKKTIEILKAAGEPTRLRIISLLAQGELAAQEISNVLGQSQPRVSRHIKLLAEARIIEKRAEGAWVFAKLGNDNIINALVQQILNSIEPDDISLARDKSKLDEIRAARENQVKDYFEAFAPEWESLKQLQQPEKAVKDGLKSLIKGQKFDFHIDLGSGTGDLLELFEDVVNRAEGIDRSRAMLALARARLDDIAGNISVRMGDILDLPYEDKSVDLITIHQVLHYLDNPDLAIKEAARVLKAGGTILIADFAPHKNEELRQLHGHKRLGFSVEELKSMAEKFGLKLQEKLLIDKNDLGDSLDSNQLKVNLLKFSNNNGNA